MGGKTGKGRRWRGGGTRREERDGCREGGSDLDVPPRLPQLIVSDSNLEVPYFVRN